MKPLERLFERDGLPIFGLPAALMATYGGDFGLTRPKLYANFVSSVDGVVALAGVGESGRVISGDNEPDRFTIALLRAAADAVLIGASNFRKADGDWWYPETVYPAAAEHFAELRKQIGLAAPPALGRRHRIGANRSDATGAPRLLGHHFAARRNASSGKGSERCADSRA